ncbi:MAG: hypothetical protein JNL79_30205 [Myxococcales bacterium]|nr:hypothetical protein [Myxococcales bacterium]
MRRRSLGVSLLVLAAAPSACNVMTGAADLEKVDCLDCVDDGGLDAGDGGDASRDATADARLPDAPSDETDAPSDTGSDAGSTDAGPGDVGDAKPDGDAGSTKACKIDSECDDLSACTADKCNKPGSALFGTCTNTRTDGDGDGESPTSLGKCGTDCHDGNKDVFSKQTAFFATAYLSTVGLASFDYDCSGAVELEKPSKYACTVAGTSCTITPGWQTVPACGVAGTWVTACARSGIVGCIPSATSSAVQRCH